MLSWYWFFYVIFKENNSSSRTKGVFTITINTVYFHCIYCKYTLKWDIYIQIRSKILAEECSEYIFNQGLRDTLKCATDFSARSEFPWNKISGINFKKHAFIYPSSFVNLASFMFNLSRLYKIIFRDSRITEN